jgi:hypothetical protein
MVFPSRVKARQSAIGRFARSSLLNRHRTTPSEARRAMPDEEIGQLPSLFGPPKTPSSK